MAVVTKYNGKLLYWYQGDYPKKYKVIVVDPKNNTKKTVQFGSRLHGQYKDITPLRLYSSYDHMDRKRRDNYRKRHGASGHQKIKFTPAWFSWWFLWP